ncbi:MAG: hypothetical protein IJE97_17320 [Thermoguttaceae bacterium]|nr:hypothetical protein [Thermoguttaceae bacterium]MBR2003337.1 hypothetical protein [Thermoguttaceae bacterium]MBR4105654.1 hypothetical protein [Thermoguttaceae bacterium]
MNESTDDYLRLEEDEYLQFCRRQIASLQDFLTNSAPIAATSGDGVSVNFVEREKTLKELAFYRAEIRRLSGCAPRLTRIVVE